VAFLEVYGRGLERGLCKNALYAFSANSSCGALYVVYYAQAKR
jgi:hypothetical protein